MTDTRKEFADWLLKEHQLRFDEAKYSIDWICEARESWQACQQLNDNRIADLLAVIELQRGALKAAQNAIDEYDYTGTKEMSEKYILAEKLCDEALAITPESVELVEVERVRIIDECPTLCGSKTDAGFPVYTINQKG